ncbi:MAG TPA: hypothetical protein VG204_05690 [Terriglobia bacterium]|nr:hypothetical protein [Terriglobia bacterium]
MNKVFSEIQRLLSLTRGIQESVNAIAVEVQAQSKRENPLPILRAELHIPHAIQQEDRARNSRKERYERIGLIIQSGTLLVVAFYAFVTFKEWKEFIGATDATFRAANQARRSANAARDANRIARESLVAVQRAFVFPNPMPKAEEVVGKTPETGEVRITIPWENSGTTPTEWMRFNIIAQFFDREMPDDFTFPEKVQAGKPKAHPYTVIPPKGSIEANVSVPVGIINQWWMGKKHVYFYGWATYRDVFPDTPEHLTRFCYEMVKVNIPPALAPPIHPGLVNYTFNLNQRRRNNCYDEQCQQK